MLIAMANQRIVIVASILLLAIFGLSQSNTYTLLGQLDNGGAGDSSNSNSNRERISISDTPFYNATHGTIIGERVIDIHQAEIPKIEVSFREDAIMENVGNVSNIGTFTEHMISPDVIRGNGEGIITSADGNSTIGWNAYDLGKRSDDRTFIFKGIIFFRLLSHEDETDNAFLFLDNQVGVYKNVVNFGSVGDYVGREIWKLN